MSITTRLLLFIIPLMLGALCAIGGFSLYQLLGFQSDLQKINDGAGRIVKSADIAKRETALAISAEINESLNLYFGSLINIFEERIHGFERVMGTVVHNSSVVTYVNGDRYIQSRLQENLVAYFSELVEEQDLSEASLITLAGKELLRAQFLWAPPGKSRILDGVPLPNVTSDESQADWFQSIDLGNQMRVSRYFYFDENFNELQPTAVLSLTKKLEYAGFQYIAGHGKLQGFLRFVIPLEGMLPEIFAPDSGFEHKIFLLDANNVVLLTNDKRVKLGEVYKVEAEKNRLFKQHVFGDGLLKLYLVLPDGYLENSMTSVMALSEAIDSETKGLERFSKSTEASIQVTAQILLAGSVVILMLVVAALFLVSTHLAKPLKWLSATTVKIGDGDLELAAKVPMKATHEIISLAAGVDQMREHLRDHIYTLDQKVQDKTDELSAYTQRLEQEVEVRRAAEVAAQDASRAKSEFLATMSHEIRTPMNGVIGMVEQLMQSELSQDQHEMADIIRLSGNHLLVIINDILDFSKIDAGKMSLEQVEVDIVKVLTGVVKLLGSEAERKGIALNLDLHPDVPTLLQGDPVRINQILINLVGNAVKFTAAGTVTLAARFSAASGFSAKNSGDVSERGKTSSGCVIFEVRDTGVGIPQDCLDHLFDPFSQVDSSTTRRFGGTGLGLSISYRLVTLMAGTLKVKSTPSEGSVFTVTLPFIPPFVAEAPKPHESAGDVESGRQARAGLRVLVAEDNPINQKIAGRILISLGITVEFVDDGVEAVKRVSDGEYDLVFMDCQMPVLDGYEATIRIRELERLHNRKPIPIIAMTANALPEDKALCLEVGMDEFVSKPIRRATLQTVLEAFGALE